MGRGKAKVPRGRAVTQLSLRSRPVHTLLRGTWLVPGLRVEMALIVATNFGLGLLVLFVLFGCTCGARGGGEFLGAAREKTGESGQSFGTLVAG